MSNASTLVDLLPADLQEAAQFAERLQQIYGEQQALRILQTLAAPRSGVCYWLNSLQTQTQPAGLPGTAVAELPDLRYTEQRALVTRSEAAATGAIYVQNASSYLAVAALDPQPGEEILDLAAAPGGKTIALAARMRNQGRIAAVEPVPRRFHRLRANVARCGVDIVEFYQRDGRSVGRAVPQRFDRVLLDAPCSSEARFDFSEPRSYRHWGLKKVAEAQRKQRGLIRSAYDALKPGGVMVYCTCSFSPEENEVVVERLLRRTDAQLHSIAVTPAAWIPGLQSWGQHKKFSSTLQHCVRVIPDQIWSGFFLARIGKPG